MNASSFHSVYLDSSLCAGCTTCIKHCPTQAIRVREGKARITEERCIDCGECIRICPKGAKKSVSDPLALMDGYDLKIALPAPSLYGQFGLEYSPSQVFDALRAIGFDEVFDVAWGAATLTKAIGGYEAQGAELPRPLVSSACPVVLRLIQLRYPSLIPNLVPFLPPVEIAAREVRRRLGDLRGDARRAGIFFISPCTSKVTAIKSPLGYVRSEIDAVFSFQDIYAPLKKALKVKRSGEEGRPAAGSSRSLPRESGLGAGFAWAKSDGELEALDIPGAVSVDGIANVIALLEEIDNGNLVDIPYIEALACPGGCVGGPMAVANPHVARTAIKAIAKSERVQKPGRPRQVPQFGEAALRWDAELQPRPVMVLDRDLGKALLMAEELEAILEGLPGLDCGACGSPDCRAFAEDIVKGLARREDCVALLKEKSRCS